MHRKLKYELGLIISAILLGGLFFNSSSQAWSRSVNLEKELHDASLVAQVKILSYDKGQLKYLIIRKPQHPFFAKYASSKNADVMEFLNAKELATLKPNGPMTSAWPAVGTEVLMVVDAKQRVSLFAARKGLNFQFWSPWESDDIPIFKCEPPAKGIPTEVHDDERQLSHEGCLYSHPFIG